MGKLRRYLIVYIIAVCSVSYAETVYDQPYLGAVPETYISRYFSTTLGKKTKEGLSNIVKNSDSIFVGTVHNIKEFKISDPVERIQFYEADVKLLSMLKGKLEKPELHLKFNPFTTGIKDGDRHILFLKTEGAKEPNVIKACYLGPINSNIMSNFGSSICSEEVGMQVLQYLIDGKKNPKLDSMLLDEYHSESWSKMYSAVVLAAAVEPEIGKDVLTETVSVRKRERFDIDLYCYAAQAIAAKQGDNGIKILLKNIWEPLGLNRLIESFVFDLAARYGSEKIVPDIIALVKENPQYVVSASYCLSNIGGDSCKNAIQSFLDDDRLSKGTEIIFDGWTQENPPVRDLLHKALSKCKKKS